MSAIERHEWKRRVATAETRQQRVSDIWGRSFEAGHVVCHMEYVCARCGAIRDDRDCSCEPARAARCRIYLEWRDQHSAM
jgi:hypothetical protein